MIVGTSQIDITPPVGVELCGFAARTQPSIGVLDPLRARALCLVDGKERLLWIHCDLIGLERPFVAEFRKWVEDALGLAGSRVMLSATHTHSGPGTVHLQECGTYDDFYVRDLRARLEQVAREAWDGAEDTCEPIAADALLTLAVDRRAEGKPVADSRLGGVGLRRADGTFAAVVVNYAMHGVALGSVNRCVSADVSGAVARSITEGLPGRPVVLVTNGACGDLNPPAENVPFEQVQVWGREIARAVVAGLRPGSTTAEGALRVGTRVVPLPMEPCHAEEIEAAARRALADERGAREWGQRLRRAVETWRQCLLREVRGGSVGPTCEAELFAAQLGPSVFIGVNAELFADFTNEVRARTRQPVYTVGYANGLIGYVAGAAAYNEGGYEVDVAHVFYNSRRPRRGGLELLAHHASELVLELAR